MAIPRPYPIDVRTPRSSALRILLTLLLLPLSTSIRAAPPPAVATMPSPAETAIRATLANGMHPDVPMPDIARWRDPLLAIYAQRNFAPLWFTGRQLSSPAVTLLLQMRAAESRGLRSADYAANRISYLASAGTADVALLDLALSVSAARFVTDLHAGRVNPRDAGNDLEVPHSTLDLNAALTALATSTDAATVLDDYEPALEHYALLKTMLARYRLLAAEPGLTELPPLPAGRRSVKPGERYDGAPALRRLLHELGDESDVTLPPPTDDALLDAQLAATLMNFQKRHGLDMDGALGAGTWRALTTPLTKRVRQIELSMERARWLPPKLGTPPILVNVPQFRLFAFYTATDSERAMLPMNVIVGRTFPENNTPIFAADMRYVVFRPYWDVPYNILTRELLPSIRADASWPARKGFEIVRGQGDDATPVAATPDNIAALARGALRLRQKPGADNALGLVKFMFPNRYNVYLHSTPSQSLFERTRRAFSHGCVRVADPVALAQYVLRDDPTWTRERIVEAMQKGKGSQRVNLARPIRVFILYATALAVEDGRALFFEDLYGHDARLEALLAARRPIGN